MVRAGAVMAAACRRPGCHPLLLAVQNAHFELAAELLEAGANPNVDLTGYTVLHAITAVRKPGVGDNDPAPEGSGRIDSLELVKKLAARGANLNARMTKRVNLNNTRANEIGATPFFLAALTADAELMKTLVALGADPRLHERREQHPADGRGRAGHPFSGRGRRHGERSAGSRAGGARARRRRERGGQQRRDRDARRGLQESAEGREVPRRTGAKIDVWNRDDKFGWTPLAIAAGYRFGNFKPSPDTEAAIREVMIAAGVTPPKTVVAKTQQIY